MERAAVTFASIQGDIMKIGQRYAAALFAIALLLQGLPVVAAGGRIDSPALLDRIQAGKTTAQQVKDILGEPYRIQRFERKGVDSWSYWLDSLGERYNVSVEIDDKGVVRTVERIRRYGP
jgi:outer membrane protein assembly factor BamE (lipoprotein component of BamABCDE complex)